MPEGGNIPPDDAATKPKSKSKPKGYKPGKPKPSKG